MQQAISVLESRVNGTGNSGAQVQQAGRRPDQRDRPRQGARRTSSTWSAPPPSWRSGRCCLRARTRRPRRPSRRAPARRPRRRAPLGRARAAQPRRRRRPARAPRRPRARARRRRPRRSAPSWPAPRRAARAKASSTRHGERHRHVERDPHGATATASATPTATSSTSTALTYGDSSKVNAATLKLFNKMVCKPGPNATTVNDSWKASIGYTEAGDQWDNVGGQIVSCDANGTKYVLGPAVIEGTQLTGITPGLQSNSTQWVVNLTLDSAATKSFGTLTTNQYNTYYPRRRAATRTRRRSTRRRSSLTATCRTRRRPRARSPPGRSRSAARSRTASPRPRRPSSPTSSSTGRCRLTSSCRTSSRSHRRSATAR